jgi:hypothetical protein
MLGDGLCKRKTRGETYGTDHRKYRRTLVGLMFVDVGGPAARSEKAIVIVLSPVTITFDYSFTEEIP